MSLQPVPIQNVPGVPDYTCTAFLPKSSDYCLLIPVINEGSRILTELGRAQKAGVDRLVDIVICDGGSTDGSMNPDTLELYGVNTLLVKTGPGKQGAQLRMGLHFALTFGYKGVLTIDGNNKDSIEDVPEFVAKLKEGYDLVQGSRFIPGGHAINTPKTRYAAVRLIHAPIISAAAHQWFTDTTNAYRAYSREYLTHPDVQPLRDVFMGYELLAYLSIRATQLGLRACEVPVTRAYPASGKTPTKISGFKRNSNLLQVLFACMACTQPKSAARQASGYWCWSGTPPRSCARPISIRPAYTWATITRAATPRPSRAHITSSASAGIMISACTQALTRSMPPAHISAGPMRPNSAASAPRPRSAVMMLPRSATLITVCAMAHF